jgi:BirA family biotin operon repressor/biotin-[acetyl-CoA-carboxylase] ligase
LTRAAPALPAGYRLVALERVGSTNDEAKRLACEGAAEGTLVWAREQQAGRGRRGRRWASPPGNLYLSLILRPVEPAGRAAQLGFAAALAVGDLLADCAEIGFKWPNDVLLAGRKVAGILLESEMGSGDALAFLVVGVGVNLAAAPDGTEFPATSVAAATGAAPDPAAALETFAHAFATWCQRWRRDGFGPLRTSWRARATGIGGPIRVRLDNVTLAGRFADIDEEGALLLESEDGRRRIAAGEIFPAA